MSLFQEPNVTMPEKAHGTYYGYDTWGCRCEPCREVKRAQGRARNARDLEASRANKLPYKGRTK